MNRPRTRPYPKETVERVRKLHAQGMRQIDIAKATGMHPNTVLRWVSGERRQNIIQVWTPPQICPGCKRTLEVVDFGRVKHHKCKECGFTAQEGWNTF